MSENIENEPKQKTHKAKKVSWQKYAAILIVMVLIISVVGWKMKGSNANPSGTASTTQNSAQTEQEIKDIMAAVSKLIVLPNETPTIATIMDAKKLIAEQSFYQGAQNGDKLLVYAKAQKAIIFSPSRNILVNVGPVYFNNQNQAQPAKAPVKTGETKPTPAN